METLFGGNPLRGLTIARAHPGSHANVELAEDREHDGPDVTSLENVS